MPARGGLGVLSGGFWLLLEPFIFAPLTRKESVRKVFRRSPAACFLFSLLLLLPFRSAPILSSCCLSRRIRSKTLDHRRLGRKPKLVAADFFGFPLAHCFLFSRLPLPPLGQPSTRPPPLGQSCTPSPY
ncbi:hypothetical protein GGI35DRAFT_320142 [Trichoderma velutinum]